MGTRPWDKDLLSDLTRAGVDAFVSTQPLEHSFLLDIRNKEEQSSNSISHEPTNSLCNQQGALRYISERSSSHFASKSVDDTAVVWWISNAFHERILPDPNNTNEGFCIHGDAEYCGFVVNQLLPAGADCLWYPAGGVFTDVELWRLRTTGLKGVVLAIESLGHDHPQFSLSKLAARFRRLRTPCSAIDYPPIYMIGEDEAAT